MYELTILSDPDPRPLRFRFLRTVSELTGMDEFHILSTIKEHGVCDTDIHRVTLDASARR